MIATYPANYIDCVQGEPEWFAARVGCVGSSRVADAVAKLKRKKNEDGKIAEAAARRNLRYELACERLTGRASEHYVSKWMEEGKDREPESRTEYELRTGNSVDLIGYVYHPRIKWAGASPDGLIGEDGLVEFKNPKAETHLEYLVCDAVPDDYQPQMLWQLLCTGRKWCDFVSYHPAIPEPHNLFVKRMEMNAEIAAIGQVMEIEVETLLLEVESLVKQIKERNRA